MKRAPLDRVHVFERVVYWLPVRVLDKGTDAEVLARIPADHVVGPELDGRRQVTRKRDGSVHFILVRVSQALTQGQLMELRRELEDAWPVPQVLVEHLPEASPRGQGDGRLGLPADWPAELIRDVRGAAIDYARAMHGEWPVPEVEQERAIEQVNRAIAAAYTRAKADEDEDRWEEGGFWLRYEDGLLDEEIRAALLRLDAVVVERLPAEEPRRRLHYSERQDGYAPEAADGAEHMAHADGLIWIIGRRKSDRRYYVSGLPPDDGDGEPVLWTADGWSPENDPGGLDRAETFETFEAARSAADRMPLPWEKWATWRHVMWVQDQMRSTKRIPGPRFIPTALVCDVDGERPGVVEEVDARFPGEHRYRVREDAGGRKWRNDAGLRFQIEPNPGDVYVYLHDDGLVSAFTLDAIEEDGTFTVEDFDDARGDGGGTMAANAWNHVRRFPGVATWESWQEAPDGTSRRVAPEGWFNASSPKTVAAEPLVELPQGFPRKLIAYAALIIDGGTMDVYPLASMAQARTARELLRRSLHNGDKQLLTFPKVEAGADIVAEIRRTWSDAKKDHITARKIVVHAGPPGAKAVPQDLGERVSRRRGGRVPSPDAGGDVRFPQQPTPPGWAMLMAANDRDPTPRKNSFHRALLDGRRVEIHDNAIPAILHDEPYRWSLHVGTEWTWHDSLDDAVQAAREMEGAGSNDAAIYDRKKVRLLLERIQAALVAAPPPGFTATEIRSFFARQADVLTATTRELLAPRELRLDHRGPVLRVGDEYTLREPRGRRVILRWISSNFPEGPGFFVGGDVVNPPPLGRDFDEDAAVLARTYESSAEAFVKALVPDTAEGRWLAALPEGNPWLFDVVELVHQPPPGMLVRTYPKRSSIAAALRRWLTDKVGAPCGVRMAGGAWATSLYLRIPAREMPSYAKVWERARAVLPGLFIDGQGNAEVEPYYRKRPGSTQGQKIARDESFDLARELVEQFKKDGEPLSPLGKDLAESPLPASPGKV